MKFSVLTEEAVQRLIELLGKENVILNKEEKLPYASDETEDLVFLPEAVVTPSTAAEVSGILKISNQFNVPVTPRGAGTGLSGGALPVFGGIIVSMEKFNRILEIDEKNLQATVEPGVINQVFQDEVKSKGLFYPPDPASRGSCFLGGNLAHSSGGPKAVKYGVTKDYVLNMEVVLPTGEIIQTGANVLKNATGYNLTQLMIGSEGTLGIITKIVFRLIPLPRHDKLMLIPFSSAVDACASVAEVFRAGLTPSGIEFMERDAIDWVMKYVEISIPVAAETQALLLVEVDGNEPEALLRDCESIAEIMTRYGCGEILFAESSEEKSRLWKIRRSVGEAVKSHSVYKEEDTVVPRAALPDLLTGVKEIGKKFGFKSVCYGHAGDGNLHVNIIKEGMTDQDWNEKIPEGIREIFGLCVSLGGTISGEHGIGYVQKPYLSIAIDPVRIKLMQGIKKTFDPNGILNPGKIFN